VGIGPSKSQLGEYFRQWSNKKALTLVEPEFSLVTFLALPAFSVSSAHEKMSFNQHLHTHKCPSICICTQKGPPICICTHKKCHSISIFRRKKSLYQHLHTPRKHPAFSSMYLHLQQKVLLSARCHLHTHINIILSARCVCGQEVQNSHLCPSVA